MHAQATNVGRLYDATDQLKCCAGYPVVPGRTSPYLAANGLGSPALQR